MKKALTTFLILLSISLLNCNSYDSNNARIKIRVANKSTQESFENINVYVYSELVDFGSLASGETTKYKSFENAVGSPFVELTVEGDTYTRQPIDQFDLPLDPGDYTFEITPIDSENEYQGLLLIIVQDCKIRTKYTTNFGSN